MAVKAALGHESKAAALLGDAPHRPTIAELPIPLKPFGAFDLVVGADGHSVWVSGSDSGRVVGYSSPDTGGGRRVAPVAGGLGVWGGRGQPGAGLPGRAGVHGDAAVRRGPRPAQGFRRRGFLNLGKQV